MVRINKRKVISAVIILLLILVSLATLYYFEDKRAEKEYFGNYDLCRSLDSNSSVRYAGSVKNLEEVKFIVDCVNEKGCYNPCASPDAPLKPRADFKSLLKPSSSNSTACMKSCFYPKEHFENLSKS